MAFANPLVEAKEETNGSFKNPLQPEDVFSRLDEVRGVERKPIIRKPVTVMGKPAVGAVKKFLERTQPQKREITSSIIPGQMGERIDQAADVAATGITELASVFGKDKSTSERLDSAFTGVKDIVMGGVGAIASPLALLPDKVEELGGKYIFEPAGKAVSWATRETIKGWSEIFSLASGSSIEDAMAEAEKSADSPIGVATAEMGSLLGQILVFEGILKGAKEGAQQLPKIVKETQPYEILNPKTRQWEQGMVDREWWAAAKSKISNISEQVGKTPEKANAIILRELPAMSETSRAKAVAMIDYIREQTFTSDLKIGEQRTAGFKQEGIPGIDKPAEIESPLIQEAKKYKSADEFVKSKSGFVHETNAPVFKEFDISKVGTGQGQDFLGRGIYLQEKGSFKIEQFGKNKIEAGLTPDANIFKIKNTPSGKYRDDFVEFAVNNEIGQAKGLADNRIKEGLSLDNLLPRDILMNNQEAVNQLRKAGFDGLLQDGELVIYNSKVIKTKSQLTDIWKEANKPQEQGILPEQIKAGEQRPVGLRGDGARKKIIRKEQTKPIPNFDNFVDVTQTKVKDIPAQEMGIAERIVGDKTAPAIRRSGFYAEKEIETAPIRDIYNQSLPPHQMALKQDGFVLGGKFGTMFKKVWKPTEKSIRSEKEFGTKNVSVINELNKKHKIKMSKKNLEHLSDVMEKKVEATPKEAEYVRELRGVLDGLRNEANVVREAMGREKIGYIEDYIPHIQKASLWNELLSNKATISDNLDFIIPNQAKNPFAYKRMLEEMENPERNLGILLDRYVSAIGKDIYTTPAIENIKAYNSVLKGRDFNDAARYWDGYIRASLIGKQHGFDISLSIGQTGRKISQKWNDMVNKAFLTGKIAWNVATQPLSYIMNTPTEAGFYNSVKAIFKSFGTPLREFVKENSNVLNIKTSDVHAVAVGEGRNVQNRIYRTKVDKWNDFISIPSAAIERELTLASYVAGLDRAKDLGYTGEDALAFADLTSARTQSMYNKENRALILNSDVLRTIFPFQSFSLEMFNHAKEIITKSKGAMQLTYRQRLGKLFRLLTALYLANLYAETLTGNKKTTPGTFIPFLGAYVDALTKKAIGEKYYGGRSPITTIQISEDIIKGSKDFIKHGDTKRLRKLGLNFGLALGGIGGGSQINNIIDGTLAMIDEEVKNVEGDTLFEVEDALSKVIAPIFGVWATKEGREYWEPATEKDESTSSGRRKTIIRK